MTELSNKIIRYNQKNLYNLLKKSIEYLIEQGRFVDVHDIRTSASSVWAFGNCMVQKRKSGYLERIVTHIFNSPECKIDDEGISFNYETWDTSLVLLAISSLNTKSFSKQIKRIQNWLHYEFHIDSVRDEPWETLWALLSLLYSEENPNKHKKKYIKAIDWLLSKRTVEDVLISAHYCGLLLGVLNIALKKLDLSGVIKEKYLGAQKNAFLFIVKEFKEGLKNNRLWRDEPWQIGHILFGISHSGKLKENLYLDPEFNFELTERLQLLWDDEIGWVDIVDTAGLTLGLSEYLFYQSEFFNFNASDKRNYNRINFYKEISFNRNIDNMIPEVFISYSRKDEHLVKRLIKALKKHGIKVFCDVDDILVGHSFVDKIYEGIRNSDYLIILLTKNSVESKWVKDELSKAKIKQMQDGSIEILPLKYEECRMPDVLSDIQYEDFTKNFNTRFKKLLRRLLPTNIYAEGAPEVEEHYPVPEIYSKCIVCGKKNIFGALIDDVSDKDTPNIVCLDCGNWI